MSGIDVRELRELEAAATAGPWEATGDHLVWPSEKGPAANDPILAVSEAHDAVETARFIAAMRNALPGLLDAAAERDAAEQERDDWKYSANVLAAQRDAAQAELAALRAGVVALAGEWEQSDERSWVSNQAQPLKDLLATVGES